MSFFEIPAISLALSLIVCWALFAILCSLVHETVVRVKSERGRFLKKMILDQFNDTVNGINWGLRVYQQGSISMLSVDPSSPSDEINPKLFSGALVAGIGGVQALNEKLQSLEAKIQKTSEEIAILMRIDSYKHPYLRQFAAACMLFQPSETITLAKGFLSRAELAATNSSGGLDEEVLYSKLLCEIESWYGELENRLTIWYKSKTKRRIFWLGVLLALVINVDSFEIFKHLNKNPMVVSSILNNYERNSDNWGKLALQDDSLGGKSKNDWVQSKSQTDSILRLTKSMDSLLKDSGLPIGWKYNIFNAPPYFENPSLGLYILKLIGILVSGVAASLGAPFWFEVLKKAYATKSK